MSTGKTELTQEIITLLIDSLNLHHVDRSTLHADTPIFGGGLELDSIDVLEIIVGLEQKYAVKIRNDEVGKTVFQTIGSIAQFVESKSLSS